MKMLLKLFLVLLFALITPFFVFFLALHFSNITTTSLKKAFSESTLYEKLVDQMNTTINDSLKKGSQDDPLRLIGPFLKTEVTTEYVQNKVEKLLDDTNEWSRGATQNQPILIFTDLKETLVQKNSKIISQLEQLQVQLRDQKGELEKTIKENGDSDQAANLEKFMNLNIPDFIHKDVSIPLGKYLYPIKLLAFWSGVGIGIISVALFLILILIYLLSGTFNVGLRWIGLSFLLSSLFTVLPVLSSVVFSNMFLRSSLESSSLPQYIVPVIQSVVTPVISAYTRIGLAVLGSFFITGVLCVVLPTFLHISSSETAPLHPEYKIAALKKKPRKTK